MNSKQRKQDSNSFLNLVINYQRTVVDELNWRHWKSLCKLLQNIPKKKISI